MAFKTMRVAYARPPLWDEIVAAFPLATRAGVLFAFGDVIYQPSPTNKGIISPAILAHEAVHGERQRDDVEGWWRRYIADPEFRLTEELIAHKVEYEHLCAGRPRNERRFYLRQIAGKLSSPLYGNLISFDRARAALRG